MVKGSGKISPAPGQEFPVISMAAYQIYPNKSRTELDLGMAKVVFASNGETSYLQQPGGIQDTTAQAKEGEKFGVEVLRRFGAGGYTAKPLPDAEVAGKAVKVYEVRDAEGNATTFYVDASTFLPAKLAFKTSQGAIEAYLRDYRPVSGLQIPFVVEQWRNGSKFLEANYTEAQVNVDVDPKLFEKPQ